MALQFGACRRRRLCRIVVAPLLVQAQLVAMKAAGGRLLPIALFLRFALVARAGQLLSQCLLARQRSCLAGVD